MVGLYEDIYIYILYIYIYCTLAFPIYDYLWYKTTYIYYKTYHAKVNLQIHTPQLDKQLAPQRVRARKCHRKLWKAWRDRNSGANRPRWGWAVELQSFRAIENQRYSQWVSMITVLKKSGFWTMISLKCIKIMGFPYLLFFFAMRIIHRLPQQKMETSPPEIPRVRNCFIKKGQPQNIIIDLEKKSIL